METENSHPYLDIDLLDAYLSSMSKSIVVQMFTLYCQQVEIYLNDIEEAQLSDSSVEWQDNCHKMKGAAASVGMIQLHGRLKLVEKTEADKEEKAILLAELQALNKQAIHAFKNWLDSI